MSKVLYVPSKESPLAQRWMAKQYSLILENTVRAVCLTPARVWQSQPDAAVDQMKAQCFGMGLPDYRVARRWEGSGGRKKEVKR